MNDEAKHYLWRRGFHAFKREFHAFSSGAGLVIVEIPPKTAQTQFGANNAHPSSFEIKNTRGGLRADEIQHGHELGGLEASVKTSLRSLFSLAALMAGLGLVGSGEVAAQGLKVLHTFTGSSGDGATPYSGLVLCSNTLYGTTSGGGSQSYGTVFKVNTDGTGFSILHGFTYTFPSQGSHPYAGLILSGHTLYGTTLQGGSANDGTVFAINIDGTGFTNLHSFGGADGAAPYAGLLLSSNTLYGTTSAGSSSFGTVFAISPDGTGFTNLHVFLSGGNGGYSPYAGLILSSNTLYGTASQSDEPGFGSIFAIGTDGTGFTNLYRFNLIFRGGADPRGGMVLSSNTLYGATKSGSSSPRGLVFAASTDGTWFTNLHNFAGADGANPTGDLILSGNTLYGTTQRGGNSESGTLFSINTDGTSFTTLYRFTAGSGFFYHLTNSDGLNPYAGLILSGNTLYGTASGGGSSGLGTVFALLLAPQLTIIPFGTNVVLSWPASRAGFDYTGFALQCTTDLVSPVWTDVSPGPVVVNGQNTVTNAVSGAKMFYRLSQ